ncbi:hypothetical protein [Mediterranea massiliensis]|uniref:hypothetical protein n=1 Tax=Mediterranea massiliensis TaxID=1841865 RepID=UPI003209AFEA
MKFIFDGEIKRKMRLQAFVAVVKGVERDLWGWEKRRNFVKEKVLMINILNEELIK